MEILIIIIAIVGFIIKAQNKATNQAKGAGSNQPNQPAVGQSVPSQKRTTTTPNQPRPRTVQEPSISGKTAAQLKEEIWSRLSEESKAKMSNPNTYQQKKSSDVDVTVTKQIQKRRMEERNTSILDRAKGNNAENDNDVTLATMEAEHNHSERVAPAIHHHEEEDLRESMLGSVEDLMVKGYDGNLCFERDFLGEAMDMISHFTAPSEIADYSGNK